MNVLATFHVGLLVVLRGPCWQYGSCVYNATVMDDDGIDIV